MQTIFIDSEGVPRQPIEETIRERVTALLKDRPEIKQYEFGEAIGRGYSWVSAFLKGKRPVTDVALLVRIARYFPVPAAYLLGESEQDTDPKTAVMFEMWKSMEPPTRLAMLGVGKAMLEAAHANDPTPPAGGAPPAALPVNTGRKRSSTTPPPGRIRR